MQWIVKRARADGSVGWTGPMRTEAHAERERDAWRDAGFEAEAIEYSDEVKREVRAWEKAKRAEARS